MRRWIAVIWAGLVFLTGCKQPNEELIKDLSILLHDRSVELQYGASKDISFTAEDFDGDVTVSSSDLPDGISVSYVFDKASGEGAVTVTSSLDEDAEKTVRLDFSDSRMTVSENLKVITNAKPVIKDPFEVETDSDTVELSMSAPSVITYTAKHFNDNVSVSLPEDEKDVILSAKFNPENGKGELSFSPAKDQNLDKSVTLSFSNGKETLSKNVRITQTKVEKDFTVALESETIEISSDEQTVSRLYYTAEGFKESVEVALPEGEKDFTVENYFDASKGTGVLAFAPVKDQDLEKSVLLTFNSGSKSVGKTIKVVQKKLPEIIKAPTLVTVTSDNDIIYPEGTGYKLTARYEVECESDFNLELEATAGVSAKLNENSDKHTGTIEITATGGLGDAATISLKASNGAGAKTGRLQIRKAVLNIDKTSFAAPFTGGTATVKVSTNVGYDYKITENPGSMLSVSRSGDIYTVTVSENTEWQPKTAILTFTDEKGYLTQTFTVSQDPSQGSPATDKAALMNIYNALNGPNWPDQGGGGDCLYSHWGNDDDIRNWYGVTIFYSGTKAQRVRNLVFIDVFAEDYTLRRGAVPEDLGRLSYLQEFRMEKSAVTSIPNSIGNLKDMQSLTIDENPLNFRLESHQGLKDLVQNAKKLKWVMLVNCGLYGPIPEWFGDLAGGNTELDRNIYLNLECNYLSGQVPDKVAKSSGWINPQWIDIDRDGYYEVLTEGELIMRQQGGDGSYALWVGEKPDNVKFVNDSHGGHWEWIGQNPYRDNSRYKKDYDQGTDPDKGFGFYNDYGRY